METTIDAVVTATERVTPGFVRVALAVREDGAWSSLGVPDEFVHLEVGATSADVDGHTSRHYTVSRVIPEGFEIEVALHGHGPGAAWGEAVRTGDVVRVSEPKAYYSPPTAEVPRVLVGDATALPAIARVLAEASADEQFTVVVELGSLADRRELPTQASAHIEWRLGGNGIAPSIVVEAAAHVTSEIIAADANGTAPYVWAACESKTSRLMRSHLRGAMGLPPKALRIVGYWHAEAERMLAVWESLSPEQRVHYDEIWRDDRTDEENWEELEPFLLSVGV